MKKGTEIIGEVVRMDYPNKGIVVTEEGNMKVACAMPGQTVRCTVKKFRHGSGEGILREVVKQSEYEHTPDCPHAGRCGGCLYQGFDYDRELEIKSGQIDRLLKPVLEKNDGRADGQNDGSVDGKNDGRADRQNDGRADWQNDGSVDGKNDGRADRQNDGSVDGKNDGRADAKKDRSSDEKGYEQRPYEEIIEKIVAGAVVDHYRNKMEYTFGDEYKGGPLALGMHCRGSMYDIETVTSCNIADRDYSGIIMRTLVFFQEAGIGFYHRVTHIGYLRHLLVRRSRKGEILIGLVTSSQSIRDTYGRDTETVLKDYASRLLTQDRDHDISGEIKSIIHITNDSPADAVKADRIDVLYGTDHITEQLLGLDFKISLFSFFQTNTYGAEALYSKVIEYIDGIELEDGAVIYDLYTGTGTIAQLVASHLKRNSVTVNRVVGVELVEEAVEAARENATYNGLDNCDFIAGDVLKVLDELNEPPALIILDPPREGIHPKALPKILSYNAQYIIYVSCKPTSLTRDLEIILESGYVTEKICPVDQFPRTGNIEVCCLLERLRSAKEHIEITIDAEDYYRIKDSENKQDE